MSKASRLLGYMARDQYGQTVHLTEPKHPRRQLLAKLGRRSARPQFTDSKTGTKHTGYVCGSQWFTVYEVREWDGRKKTS